MGVSLFGIGVGNEDCLAGQTTKPLSKFAFHFHFWRPTTSNGHRLLTDPKINWFLFDQFHFC